MRSREIEDEIARTARVRACKRGREQVGERGKERQGESEKTHAQRERARAHERESYEAATISRLLKIIGLFCNIYSLL